ncbi:MAG TPA: hypothetical protein VLU06_01910 [Thermoanaerobaculia bacterium]|nr:hypothetical protein [Thermoanaerobaculia bacterium]
MTHPLRLEDIVEKALAARPKSRLLAGLGAKISVASDLPPRREIGERLAAGVEPLDRLLSGGLPRGLVELVGRRSSGRFSIGLAALTAVTSAGEPAALLDPEENLDPQAAAAEGVDLELLLWVRPRRVKETLAAAEMLLAAGFPLVVADLGLSARGGRFIPDAAWIRLARASQAQGASLLLLTPGRMSGIAAEAVLTADAPRPHWRGSGKSPRLLAGLSSRLTLQKLARAAPATTQPLRLSLQPPGEGRGEGATNADSLCNPEERCHPEERSDEGSTPTLIRRDRSRSFAALRMTEPPITNLLRPSLPPITFHLPPSPP